MHHLLFEPITEQKVKQNSFHKLKKVNYQQIQGKVVRKITIATLDPFGYSAGDTLKKPDGFLAKSGNFLHAKTHRFAIANILLIKRNKPLDSLLVKESERLIRSQRFVRSVVITTKLVSADSVDVSIRVLDSWSLVPDISISSTKSSFYLKEKNFFGTGHEFSNSYTNDLTSSRNGFGSSYTVPNIMHTFIKTTVSYSTDIKGNYSKVFNIERPFFSPYARWAAGINLDQQFEIITTVDENLVETLQNSKYNSYDFWAGHSYQIFKGNTEYKRATNFITTARFFNKNYIEKPIIGEDSLGIYSNEKLYLIGLGISSRKFTQDKYVFNFDVIEDIPSGFAYSITTGYQDKNDQFRFYFGAKINLGSYFEFGYLSGKFEYGAFFNNNQTEQGAYNLSLIYFTNLIESGAGRWKFRQFIKPQAIIGTKRLNSKTDELTLNGATGIQGFNSKTLYGTKKILITFQTQGYSPWQVYGFRLNPFINYTMGMLGQDNIGFSKSKLYSELGVGVIISNDYLVFNNFQFSFSYFPNLPIDQTALFNTNSIKSYDLGLQTFEVAEPLLVEYK